MLCTQHTDETRAREIETKIERLKVFIEELESVAVAFSGGVDSAFLLFVAHETLGPKCLALTARMPVFPESEYEEARDFCARYAIEQSEFTIDILNDQAICANPENRCYLCKKTFLNTAQAITEQRGLNALIEGSNIDDLSDYRPGRAALEELHIISPLVSCGFSKRDIRDASALLNLPTQNKPSYACLASRFPYGEPLTTKNIRIVALAEEVLHAEGFENVRVRASRTVSPNSKAEAYTARIEVEPADIARFADAQLREKIAAALKTAGFTYVSVDLEGYRSGSLNVYLPSV